MKVIRTGATRWVIVIGNLVFKIPRTSTFRSFLNGVLANEQEHVWSKAFKKQGRLCPVLFTFPLYLVIVMPKVKVLTNDDCRNGLVDHIDFDEFLKIGCDKESLYPAEKKADSFGWLNGNLVIINYIVVEWL